MADKSDKKSKKTNKAKILLALPPFWSPLIPPMGIAYLKSYLEPHGYRVKTLDVNVEEEFKEIYNKYFDTLRNIVPEDKQGNLHNIGHDVMQNHMMAHIHYKDEDEYIELVKLLVYNIFYTHITTTQVKEINRIFDTFYSKLEKYWTVLLALEKPNVVGLTAYCGNLPAAIFIFRITKKMDPNIKTILGGGIFSQQLGVGSPNYHFFLEKTSAYIDKIIIGEGQKLFLNYLEGKLPESKRVYTLKDINQAVVNLSRVILPDLSDYDLSKYNYVGAQGSRSCPNQCDFCNSRVFWGQYTKRSSTYVVEEMTTLYRKCGIQLFYMADSLLNPMITELSKELIKRDVPLYYDAYLRVYEKDSEPVSDVENTLLWRKGGFYRARMGCESGSQRILDSVGKGITVEQIKTAVSSLAFAGIKTTTYWVVGLPGETEEDFQKTLALVEELKNDIYQAECAAFIYYYNGQNKSDVWASQRKLLFPQEAADMLITQTWILNDPPREVVYERLNRFACHIKRLGIPNPFSLHEIIEADERWKKVQKNATPSLLEFKRPGDLIMERHGVKNFLFAQGMQINDDGDFGF